MTPTDLARRNWDAIVVGTGMGGAATGWALARAGWQVLFCEQGHALLHPDESLSNAYAEEFFDRSRLTNRGDILAQAGRWNEPIRDDSQRRSREFVPFIGSGTGGSTALYGMVLERLQPNDFSPSTVHPDGTGSTHPHTWPIRYEELLHYYRKAEQLLRVRGSADPLKPETAKFLDPPSLTAAGSELFDFFNDRGLHPYRPPLACEHIPQCRGCQGYLCDRGCKNDGNRVFLQPALREHGAQLLANCEVLRLEATATEVTGVVCNLNGNELTMKGAVVILAAGALATPRILLRSRSRQWPQGLANSSGLVGNNLMRHQVDLYAVFTRAKPENERNLKELAFSDWYAHQGEVLGSVQSFGPMPPAAVLSAEMGADLRSGPARWLAGPAGLVIPPVARGLSKLLSRTTILATTLEDLPYTDNRVTVDEAGGLHFQYRIHEYERRRLEQLRGKMQSVLRPYRFLLLRQAENNQRLAHVCGTCRFGEDPENSVLEASNRAHGLNNLYVTDASFFPTSGGTNPGLTIAANALRVADCLLGRKPNGNHAGPDA